MNNIFVYIESIEMFYFFLRFSKVVSDNNSQIIFHTTKLSIFIMALLKKTSCKLIFKTKKKYKTHVDLYDTLELKRNFLDIEEASLLFNSSYEHIEKVNNISKINLILSFNGSSIPDIAFNLFARRNNVKTLYFELANIPGKMFCDPLGVNAKSSLYKNINILDKYKTQSEVYHNWLKSYLKIRENLIQIPQVNQRQKYINYLYFFDILGILFLNLAKNCKFNIHRILYNKSNKIKININYDDFDYKNKNFIFLGLQLSLDSQILLNSDIDNIEALYKAIKISKSKNIKLVVKIHPLENDKKVINKILSLREKYGFYLMNLNSFELVKYADSILTINSSIGLEAKILGKTPTIYGRSFYSMINESNLPNYICKYLIDLNFFSEAPIPKAVFRTILKRAS